MSKYGKEIAIGFIPVLVVFLVYIGVNIIPVIFICAVCAILFMMTRAKGSLWIGNHKQNLLKSANFMTFAEIGGQSRAKHELQEALDLLIRYETICKLGIRPLKGILLTGPPGTGKTLMAKASAHYTNSLFIAVSGSEFVEMYVGVGASRVRQLFDDAKTRAIKENKLSAIIFIDEIEVIGGKRDGGQQREYDQTLNQLLTEMDGIHTSDSPRVLVMAATNRKELLDSALIRPGRFDRHIQVDLPDKEGRLHILRIHAKNKPLAVETDLEDIAKQSYGFSGAQLESVMNEAAIYAMREGKAEISAKHCMSAIDKILLGEKSDRETSKEERIRVAYHELGHAITAELLKSGSVSQVSLSPRGQALGFVRHQNAQDQYLYTKAFIQEQIMIALGGSVAEEMFYGCRSTGSRNDFEQAINLVELMFDSGLTSLGVINRSTINKDELMKENAVIFDDLVARTRELLEKYRTVFAKMLEPLLQNDVLSGEQFRTLLSA